MVFYSSYMDTAGSGKRRCCFLPHSTEESFDARVSGILYGLDSETDANELFDKSHGFYLAVIQGFFRGLLLHQREAPFPFLQNKIQTIHGTLLLGNR